jgi:Xaa-Pro aminopeptidase
MSTYFSAEFFAGNRTRLKDFVQDNTPIILTANGLLQQSTDSTYPFKQDGNFWYLSGINEPDITLVIDSNNEYLILPEQSEYQRYFNGAIDSSKLSKISGIKKVLLQKEGENLLNSLPKKSKKVATLTPSPQYINEMGFYTNPSRQILKERIHKVSSAIEFTDLRKQFGQMRMVKQACEVEAIQSAIDVTVKTLQSVKNKINSYEYEYQAEADVVYGFRNNGSDGLAFDSIVAGGANACIVHYMDNKDELNKNDLLLFDVGAEVNGYAADISRTYSRGTASERQMQVHAAVCEVQDYAYSLLKPGVLLREYEKQIREFMGKKLQELSLIDNLDPAEIRKYYPHSTSHFLGFDVHDVGDYDRPLEPGVVITVEPGIYIPEEGIGVRIEDDILITKSGNINLSRKLSRNL